LPIQYFDRYGVVLFSYVYVVTVFATGFISE